MSHAKPSCDKRVEIKKCECCQPLRSSSIQTQQWQHYIEQKIGFVLPEDQERWLINAINDTATSHELTAQQLWESLPTHPKLEQALLDAVLIPESRFFRHKPSIKFVTKWACEYQRCVSGTPYRIWSVGCSAGQEAWSLAMSLHSQGVHDYQIVGSDVNQQVLDQARTGCFDARQRHLIPKAYEDMIQPLTEDADRFDHKWQVVDQLRDRVRFVWHNVFTQSVPVTQLQHVIICQNMLIYFRQFDQRDILTKLAASCEIGGYIVLAPGEALFWRPKNMRRIVHSQVNAWQKISA